LGAEGRRFKSDRPDHLKRLKDVRYEVYSFLFIPLMWGGQLVEPIS